MAEGQLLERLLTLNFPVRGRGQATNRGVIRMAGDTLTFEMGGRVEVGQFQQGIAQFAQLVAALTQGTGVRWVIDDLHPGSAVVTLRGEAEDTGKVERIVGEYDKIGRSVERREDLPYSRDVNRAAQAINNVARTFEYARFETLSGDYTISGNGTEPPRRTLVVSIGAITGRVQTLSNRVSLRFNLCDTVHDKAVGCYLQPGQEELMRKAWGRRARVSGRVSRENDSGRPVAVRQILDIEIIEEIAPGSYRHARGAVPWQPED